MMKKILLIFTLCLNYFSLFAQEETGLRVYSYPVKDIYFKKYEENYKIKAEISDLKNVTNVYPEQLLQSVLSSTNYEWDCYNTLGGKEKAKPKSEKHYQNVKTMDKDLNYFKPMHKIEFKIEGNEVAIIKYIIYSNKMEKPMAAVMVMQKINNRWYKTSTSMVTDLALLILNLKSTEFENILKGQETDPILKEVKNQVFVNGNLDLIKFIKIYESWSVNNTDSNKAKIEYFKDPLSIL